MQPGWKPGTVDILYWDKEKLVDVVGIAPKDLLRKDGSFTAHATRVLRDVLNICTEGEK